VDVRIIGATNANLQALADDGTFKRDLLDRLSFEVLYLPPLRERREDIPVLANHFAARMAFELGRKEIPEFSDAAVAALERHPWPGNVRELKNVVERAVYRANRNPIDEIIFDPFQAAGFAPCLTASEVVPATPAADAGWPVGSDLADKPFNDAVREFEVRLLRRALEEAHYNQKRAAEILDLTYHQFRGLYRKYQDVFQE
jgi:psp operon transcriptional activator